MQAEALARQLVKSPGRDAPPPASHIILAQSLIGQERFKDALEPLLYAINTQRKMGGNVRENWLALLSSVYFSLEDFESLRTVLYELVNINPKEQYLINLAAINGQLGEPDKQLALVEAMKDDNRLVTESHLMTLANLFMVQKLPFKAAALLEAEIAKQRIPKSQQTLQLQSQAWYLAGEYNKAIPPLQEAAKMSNDGELWLRVARLYVALYDWKNAEAAAQFAVEKGDLKKPGSALILQGMAMVNQGKYRQAKKILRQAGKYKDSIKWSTQWLTYIDNEQKRLAQAN
ncbi:MAG: hypothetical protein WBN40_11210 [Pseudomonadales bacterium]